MNTTRNLAAATPRPVEDRLGTAVRQWLGTNSEQLRLWRQRANARRRLLSMTDRELDDIGITREAAKQEAAKRFWEA